MRGNAETMPRSGSIPRTCRDEHVSVLEGVAHGVVRYVEC